MYLVFIYGHVGLFGSIKRYNDWTDLPNIFCWNWHSLSGDLQACLKSKQLWKLFIKFVDSLDFKVS